LRIALMIVTTPSTNTVAAKKTASTNKVNPGHMKASTPKITDAMPPISNAHHACLSSACIVSPWLSGYEPPNAGAAGAA
jgi:hypothetical protein